MSIKIGADELYYEVRGQGQPLLMIPPAGGDGWQYSYVADILADEYKVVTYDRRANARSTMNYPQNFEISQQSRDAVAVLHAVSETCAFVIGNSSGAVIALDMAKTQPQATRAVIVHEAPIPGILPRPREMATFLCQSLCDVIPLWLFTGRAAIHARRSTSGSTTDQGYRGCEHPQKAK